MCCVSPHSVSHDACISSPPDQSCSALPAEGQKDNAKVVLQLSYTHKILQERLVKHHAKSGGNVFKLRKSAGHNGVRLVSTFFTSASSAAVFISCLCCLYSCSAFSKALFSSAICARASSYSTRLDEILAMISWRSSSCDNALTAECQDKHSGLLKAKTCIGHRICNIEQQESKLFYTDQRSQILRLRLFHIF